MSSWAIVAVAGAVISGVCVVGVAGLVVWGVVEAARLDRRCTCGHTYGEHVSIDLMGFPCTACQTCAVFTAEGAS